MLDIKSFQNTNIFKCQPRDRDTMAVRMRELEWISNLISNQGHNLEFGVYKARTINKLSDCCKDKLFYGFDSFRGLPEDWDMGDKYVKKNRFHLDELPKVNYNVELIEGFFEDTLKEWIEVNNLKYISFLHIDCDLYSSTKYVLSVLAPFIKKDTIIRFDELACWRSVFGEEDHPNVPRSYYKNWQDHEWKALNEWVEEEKMEFKILCRNWFQSAVIQIQ
jgi:hypothetical protein